MLSIVAFLRNKNKLSRACFLLLSFMLSGAAACAQDRDATTFSVYFPTGITALSTAAKKTLDSLVYRGAIRPRQRLIITGFADEPGTTRLNDSLSQRRAQTVADYLTQDGFLKKEDISAISGRGYDATRAGRGNNPRYRRADIAVSDGPPAMPRPMAPLASPSPAARLPRLDTMKANATLTLEDVLFENNSDIVLPSSVGQLESLLAALQENPSVRIRLEGHVCCGNGPEYGQDISNLRAKAVYDYLVRYGIDRSRLAWRGFGFSAPRVFPERSEEDRQRNRRVEMRILSK